MCEGEDKGGGDSELYPTTKSFRGMDGRSRRQASAQRRVRGSHTSLCILSDMHHLELEHASGAVRNVGEGGGGGSWHMPGSSGVVDR
jgi:hypothetical protein